METFFELYRNIPEVKKRSAFRDKIVEVCNVKVFTFYGWLRRGDIPKWHKNTIASFLDKEQEQLFPAN